MRWKMKNLRIVVVLLLLIESAWPVSGLKDGNCNDVSYGILKNVFNCTVDGDNREGICGVPQRISYDKLLQSCPRPIILSGSKLVYSLCERSSHLWRLFYLHKSFLYMIGTEYIGNYSTVIYEASCEKIGSATLTSLDDCQKALQELRLNHTPRGTTNNSYSPAGCYLRYDGDLWYNVNGESTEQCSSKSKCICRKGEFFCWNDGTDAKNTEIGKKAGLSAKLQPSGRARKRINATKPPTFSRALYIRFKVIFRQLSHMQGYKYVVN